MAGRLAESSPIFCLQRQLDDVAAVESAGGGLEGSGRGVEEGERGRGGRRGRNGWRGGRWQGGHLMITIIVGLNCTFKPVVAMI